MHPELVKVALACARSAFGDVGLIAVTPLDGAGETGWRLVLITDTGPQTVIAQTTLTAPFLVLTEDPS